MKVKKDYETKSEITVMERICGNISINLKGKKKEERKVQLTLYAEDGREIEICIVEEEIKRYRNTIYKKHENAIEKAWNEETEKKCTEDRAKLKRETKEKGETEITEMGEESIALTDVSWQQESIWKWQWKLRQMQLNLRISSLMGKN